MCACCCDCLPVTFSGSGLGSGSLGAVALYRHNRNGNRCWRLYAVLHGRADGWFHQLLTALQLLGTKRLSMDLLTDHPEVRHHLLAGFLDGDGHLKRQGGRLLHSYTISVASAVSPLADQLVHLSRCLGYSTDAVRAGTSNNEQGDNSTACHGTSAAVLASPHLPTCPSSCHTSRW